MTKRNLESGFAYPPEPVQTVDTKTTLHGDRDEVTVKFGDGSTDLKMSRRDFLRISGVAAATAAMAGAACRNPVEHIEPYVDRPQEIQIGFPNIYATVSPMSPIFGSATVKTRTGRPIFVGANQKSPRFGCVGAPEIASYLDLWDPDRARAPKRIGVEDGQVVTWDMSWQNLDQAIIKTLNSLGASANIAILQTLSPGLSQDHLFETIQKSVPNLKRYFYQPLNYSTVRQVTEAAYGVNVIPQYRFDRSKTIVSFGCDFIGTWLTPEEFSGQFVQNRDADDLDNFSRLHVFEGNMTLTGMNADERYRVLPSHLPAVACAVARGVLEKTGGNPNLISSDFTVDAVAKRTGVDPAVLTGVIDELVANKGNAFVIGGGITSESTHGPGLEAAVVLINQALGAFGKSVVLNQTISHTRGGVEQIEALIRDINNGKVDVLFISQANPIYHLPKSVGFAEALKKVKLVVCANDRMDETAKHAHYLATASHPFESWGDAVSYDGIYSVRQAIIQPLYQTRDFETSLLLWFGQSLCKDSLGDYLVPPKLPTDNRGGNVPTDAGPYYRFVHKFWKEVVYPQSRALAPFDNFWSDTLRQGFVEMPLSTYNREVTYNQAAVVQLLPKALPPEKPYSKDLSTKELQLFSTASMGDGTQANNGKLQEQPDPVTHTVWTTYVMLSPKTFLDNELELGQYIDVTVNGETKRFPACFQPGLHDGVICIPVGYGRTDCGAVGDGIGENAFAFTNNVNGKQCYAGLKTDKVKILPHGEMLCHIHGGAILDLSRRNIMSIASIDEYKASKTAGIHEHPPLPSFWKHYEYTTKWGKAVDLNKCTNCGACVMACTVENNVPVVGAEAIREAREMHWLRMDRYYLLPDEAKPLQHNPITNPMFHKHPEIAFGKFMDNPRVVWQPMMCQQCERAPCENVCPVAATSHSKEGLNMMAYNRCVGTRYCANNCPYKVRRFNWFNYSTNRSDSLIARFLYPELKRFARLNVVEPLGKGMNPDVTVRSRGVMEKCTFCVQRIRRAKWANLKLGRRDFRDGDVVTACEEVCSTGAIAFGNLVDESSKVAKWHASPRALTPLSALGVLSSVAYLTRIVNTSHKFNADHGHHVPGHAGDSEIHGEHEAGHAEHDHQGHAETH